MVLCFMAVIDDDVVKSAVSGIGEEFLDVKILYFEVEFAADWFGFEVFASFHL